MGVGFDPLMCAPVTIPFIIVSLGATTLKKLKDMGVGFDPLMCARVTIPFIIVSLGATTRSTTT
jgi:hypothetical protein